jgi:hypothetical protein
MPGTTNRFADDKSIGKRSAVVRAVRADCKQLVVAPDQEHGFTVRMPEQHGSIGDVRQIQPPDKIRAAQFGLLFAHWLPSKIMLPGMNACVASTGWNILIVQATSSSAVSTSYFDSASTFASALSIDSATGSLAGKVSLSASSSIISVLSRALRRSRIGAGCSDKTAVKGPTCC